MRLALVEPRAGLGVIHRLQGRLRYLLAVGGLAAVGILIFGALSPLVAAADRNIGSLLLQRSVLGGHAGDSSLQQAEVWFRRGYSWQADSSSLRMQAVAELQRGCVQPAVRLLNQALARGHRDAVSLWFLQAAAIRQDDEATAAQALARLSGETDRVPLGLLSLGGGSTSRLRAQTALHVGQAARRRDDNVAAEVWLRAAHAIDPGWAEPLVELGIVQRNREEWADAVSTVQAAIADGSDTALTHFLLAGIFFGPLDRPSEARAEFLRSIALDPAYSPFAYTGLSTLDDRAGDPASAESWLVRARAQFPDSPWPLYSLGQLAEERGDQAAARLYLGQALQLAPDEPNIRSAYAAVQP